MQLSLLIRACSLLITSLPRLPGTEDELEAHFYRFRSFFEMCDELIRVMLQKFDLLRDVVGDMRTTLIGVIQDVAEGDRTIRTVDEVIHREFNSLLCFINCSGRTTSEYRYTRPLTNVAGHYRCLESLPDPFASEHQNWAFDTVSDLVYEFQESVLTARSTEDVQELFERFLESMYDHLRAMDQVENWNRNWERDVELGDDISIASSANDTNNASVASDLSIEYGSDEPIEFGSDDNRSLFSSVARSVARDVSIADDN